MNQTNVISASAGLNGGEYITAGETATSPSGRKIAFFQAIGGDVTLSGITGAAVTGLPNDLALTQDVVYALSCATVTLDGSSSGDLIVFYV
jgi:hypothetical protein